MSDEKQSGLGTVARYGVLGILLPASTFVGYAIGYGLDTLFGTRFLRIVFLILGTVSGFVQFIRQLSREPR
jgi:F0F1-type ATP synthase assembly protein I